MIQTEPRVAQYDLEERTWQFANRVNRYVNALPKTVTNIENGKQLARSGGSVGANYIEANESLGKRDFLMRARIAKKEAKESRFWLSLSQPDQSEIQTRDDLIQEATELMKILGAIITNSQNGS